MTTEELNCRVELLTIIVVQMIVIAVLMVTR